MNDPVMWIIIPSVAVVGAIVLAVAYRRKWLAWIPRIGNGSKQKEDAPIEPPRPLCPICQKPVDVRRPKDAYELKELVIQKKEFGAAINEYDWHPLPQVAVERKQRRVWKFLLADTSTHIIRVVDGELDVCGTCYRRAKGEADVMVKALRAEEARAHQREMETVVKFNSDQMRTLREREKQEAK